MSGFGCSMGLVFALYYDAHQNILNFPNGTHDDLADALAQAINRLFGGMGFWVV